MADSHLGGVMGDHRNLKKLRNVVNENKKYGMDQSLCWIEKNNLRSFPTNSTMANSIPATENSPAWLKFPEWGFPEPSKLAKITPNK